MTESVQDEINRELRLQYEGLLNRIEDQTIEIDYLKKQVLQLQSDNQRLKWALREQD